MAGRWLLTACFLLIAVGALNTVPLHQAGMASATTNLLRDLGFALGPVLAGAVALSSAGANLGAALQSADLPADQADAANAIAQASGPSP